ncbi:MAG TPA: Na+/H+ antiporter NhaC family protein, partial [Candidatus Krumholzibacteria bacterium]|nr:Na+/H+ antiporter NhaC family protein [Candidatus Krumholzibacteria bacterium]
MRRPAVWIALIAILASWPLAGGDSALRALWPPLVALAVIAATRHALAGLLAGGYCGAVILAGGDPWQAYLAVFRDHLAPSLGSTWKTGAILFTLVLGGFAAVLEAGGGFRTLLERLTAGRPDAARRFQLAAGGLGLLCFFDGLANSMMVGRVGRDLADRSGTPRVKLAYIVDSTSSAVACVALVSTWIAFQLAMIKEGYALAGRDVNPYAVFLASLPANFHCWFTLVLLFVAIVRGFDPGPMGSFTAELRARGAAAPPMRTSTAPAASALVPLAVLLAAFFAGFYVLGADGPLLPVTREKLVASFGSDAGPKVMVLAGLVATASAAALFPTRGGRRFVPAAAAFLDGARTMIGPVIILAAAWILGSVLGALGTAERIAGAAANLHTPALLPAATFVTGAIISFATGTSWGTMGILFPLAIPAAAGAIGSLAPGAQDTFLAVIVAAVFSGAVFGDHCSPFSDTTIVTSIACGVETHDHVRTQIPYALIAAAVAIVAGFLPAGFGVPSWV